MELVVAEEAEKSKGALYGKDGGNLSSQSYGRGKNKAGNKPMGVSAKNERCTCEWRTGGTLSVGTCLE